MLLVSLLFKFLAFVFLMFFLLLFSNDWTWNGTLWHSSLLLYQPLYSTLLWHSTLLVKEASHNYTHVCAATAKKGIINTARIKKKKFVHCYCKNICPESKKRCLKNVLNFCEHSCLKVDGMLKGAWRRGWKAIWEKCI